MLQLRYPQHRAQLTPARVTHIKENHCRLITGIFSHLFLIFFGTIQYFKPHARHAHQGKPLPPNHRYFFYLFPIFFLEPCSISNPARVTHINENHCRLITGIFFIFFFGTMQYFKPHARHARQGAALPLHHWCRGTSLIRKRLSLGPYSRHMPRTLWWS